MTRPRVAVRRPPPACRAFSCCCWSPACSPPGWRRGLGSALAADPSASPGADKVVLHVGWTNDPDNLNPFIGAETSSYEIWLLNYDFLTGYSLDLQPTPGPRRPPGRPRRTARPGPSTCATGVKWQDGVPFTADDVAFTYNYIVDNEMGAFSSLTTFIDEAVAIDDLTVEIRCSKPKANMITHLDPDPARARLEQGRAPRRPAPRTRTSRPSSAPGPSRRSRSRRATTCAWSRTRRSGARSRPSTRSSSSPTRTRTR